MDRSSSESDTQPREGSWSIPATLLLGVAAVLALLERLEGPLGSPVIGAEDPYTHMVFIKEHLARGYFEDSLHLATSLYPPGLHILVGALHALSGVSLYALARFLPAVFGMMSVVGVFILAHRLGGLAAATVAAGLLVAMPEHVFRTNLLFPTALDLALVPVLLLAAAEVTRGRYAWIAVAVPVGLALVIAHPWIAPLTALGVAAFAGLLAFTVPPAEIRTTTRRSALVVALFGVLSATALLTRWSEGGESSFQALAQAAIPKIPLLLGVAALGLGALLLGRGVTRAIPPVARRVVRAGLVAGVLAVALPMMTQDLPEFVAYESQIGWFAIGLALAGLALLPLVSEPGISRLGLLGAGLATVTFPLTAINFFDSPYWPHRTVGYLTLAVAVLGGTAAAILVHGIARAADRVDARTARPGRGLVAGAIGTTIALVVAGSAVATAPSQYDWYRLYDEEEFQAFRWAEDRMEEEPGAVFVEAHWKSNLMLKALGDPERVHYRADVFKDAGSRHEFLNHLRDEGYGPIYVVIDDAHREKASDYGWDLTFVEWEGYDPMGAWGNVTIHRAPTGGGQ